MRGSGEAVGLGDASASCAGSASFFALESRDSSQPFRDASLLAAWCTVVGNVIEGATAPGVGILIISKEEDGNGEKAASRMIVLSFS